MPDILDQDGLTLKTSQEIKEELEAGYRNIYGSSINITPDAPDGQKIAMLLQMALDNRDMLQQIYSSFNPNNAVGTVLDQRVAINNIQRISGDFTLVPVDITVDRALELKGLDAQANDPDATDAFTIQDNGGNKFLLVDTHTFVAGQFNKSLIFRSQKVGALEVTVNTIQTQVTIVLGVTNVNNSSGVLTQGEEQESDPELRLRRERSVAKPSSSYVDSIRAEIFSKENVIDCLVFENVADVPDADGIPAHSIWAIVEGGSSDDIAQAIYDKKSDGSGMKGSIEVEKISQSGQIFLVKFDRVIEEDLYIQFVIKRTNPAVSFNTDAVAEYLVNNLNYSINEPAENASIIGILSGYLEGGIPIDCEISNDGSSWVDYLETSTKQHEFVVDVSRINISIET